MSLISQTDDDLRSPIKRNLNLHKVISIGRTSKVVGRLDFGIILKVDHFKVWIHFETRT